jgi:putative ABC transport system permease protein
MPFPTLTDLRRALRTLLRDRGYLAAAVLTLTVGIGATTALFGVVNAVLLRPLPFAEPARLVRVWPEAAVGKATFVSLREKSRTFASLAAYQAGQPVSVLAGETPSRATAAPVTGALFATLGVEARLGRALRLEDETAAAERVAVVSDAFWRERLGADPGAIGRLVRVDGIQHRVVGVMPPTFRLPSADVGLWVPARLDPRQFADYTWYFNLNLVGRLAPGVTAAQARAEMRTLVPALRAEFPMRMPDDWGASMDVQPLQETIVGRTRGTLYLLLAAVGLTLLVAVVNVAGLTLVRTARRERELTVRAALGAGRARLLRELTAEGLVLAAGAALLGSGLAWLLTRAIVRLLPGVPGRALPRADEITIDGAVLAVATLVALATGVLATLLPAMRASRPNMRGALAEGGRYAAGGRARQRTLALLVTAQVALGVTLAAGAGMLGLSLVRLLDVDPGFRAQHVTVAEVPLPSVSADTTARARAFYGALEARVRALPGVDAAAMATGVPFGGGEGLGPIDVEASPIAPGGAYPTVAFNTVTPGLPRVLGVPLLHGRDFAATDDADAPAVALVDAEAARVLWPGRRDVVGQRIKYVYLKSWITVVGVVGSVRRDSLSAAPMATIYRPLGQQDVSQMRLVVRGTADATTLAPALGRIVRELEPTVPLGTVRPLAGLVADSAARPRFVAQLLAAFALVAVVLGAVGVYGVVAFAVARRTRELGVRSALGATPGAIRALVLRDGGRLAAAGVVVGLAGALASGRLLQRFLFGVGAADPLVLGAVSALLLAVVLVASALPARRAARVDPLTALRTD